jgi:hypothetical protein
MERFLKKLLPSLVDDGAKVAEILDLSPRSYDVASDWSQFSRTSPSQELHATSPLIICNNYASITQLQQRYGANPRSEDRRQTWPRPATQSSAAGAEKATNIEQRAIAAILLRPVALRSVSCARSTLEQTALQDIRPEASPHSCRTSSASALRRRIPIYRRRCSTAVLPRSISSGMGSRWCV